MWEQREIGGKSFRLLREGEGPVFIWACGSGRQETDRLADALKQMIPGGGYGIAVCEVEDWNRDLSPWEAPAATGDEGFAGGGPATLAWLTDELLPRLRENFPEGSRYYLTGYSLAGLFALWALYETDCFDGAVCCSGSLWLDGWDRYVSGRRVKAPADIYLSLGGKEEKTGNRMMAQVGERTRQQEALLRKDPMVRRCRLEWNPGGHFADPAGRLAKGIVWITSVCKQGASDALSVS